MTTYQPFGTDRCLGTALRVFSGVANRRAHEAILFPIHPAHYSNRDDMRVARWYVAHLVKL